MVGPARPARPPMAPQSPAQPHQQLILKQVPAPFTMITKPPTANIVNYNYLSVPLLQSNTNFLTVARPAAETNGLSPRVSPASAPTPVIKETPSSNSFASPHAHQYLIPKAEKFPTQNFPKSDRPGDFLANAFVTPTTIRRSPAAARPTNHQRIPVKDSEDEGEEERPRFDPGVPFKEQMVRIEHNYPLWLPPPSPKEDDKESTISSDEKVDHNEEGEETETAGEGEDSVTRCICNLEHDDGYMISCDECFVWQHVACVLPDTPTPLPDMSYLCDICQPRPLDRTRARTIQLQRRKQIMLLRGNESDDSGSSNDRPPPKKAVARRRAEPIIRKPSKRESIDGPPRPTKLLDTPIRSKLLKSGPKGRRDSVKTPATPTSPGAAAVIRKNKLKKKFENKVALQQRRKSQTKTKEGTVGDLKPETDEEKRQATPLKGSAAKMRCRLSYTGAGQKQVVSISRVAAGDLVTELRGKFLPQGANQKVEVLFKYRLPKDGTEVFLDGSARENVVRYANRVCSPNTYIKHAMVKGSLRLYVVATDVIEKNQEIFLPHGCVVDTMNGTVRESCGKNCTYNPLASPPTTPQKSVITSPKRRPRRSTVGSEESDHDVEGPLSPLSPTPSDRKLTREEKKIEQAMKIFAAMEKETARRREKPMSAGYRKNPDSDKESPSELSKLKRRRKRRKRRNSSRKNRTGSGSNQAQSGEESDLSSGDEADKMDVDDESDAAGLLLALSGHPRHNTSSAVPTTPVNGPRDHSENDSSPSTPMSSACLLVAAALGPLAPGFKFPKTKKGMANEYQDRQLASSDMPPNEESVNSETNLPCGAPKLANISNQLYYPARDHFAGKKRWLRWQPNSGDVESPLGSPPCPPDNVTPLKKRRMARESLNCEPSTPEPGQISSLEDETAFGAESPKSSSPVDLAERVRAMQRDYLAAQGIEAEPCIRDAAPHLYPSSPQLVPENLTVRPASPEQRLPRPPSPQEPPPVLEISPISPRVVEPTTSSPPPLSPPDLSQSISPMISPPRKGRKRPTARVEPCTKRPLDIKEEEKVEPSAMNGETDSKLSAGSTTTLNYVHVVHSVDSFEHPPLVKPADNDTLYIKRESVVNDGSENLWFMEPTFKRDGDVMNGSNMDLLAHEATKEIKLEVKCEDVKEECVDSNAHDVWKKPLTIAEEKEKQDEIEDKAAPMRRKLSITEYLKRKKSKDDPKVKDEPEGPPYPTEAVQPVENPTTPTPSSPVSDDDISPLLIPTPTMPSLPFLNSAVKGSAFKAEPTELERQRENLNERLRREFGLAISDDDKPKKNVEAVTNGFSEFEVKETLPQSDIYPVGCSNPPNPFATPYPAPERRKFRK